MVNPFKEVDWNPDRAQRRSFAISLLVGFPAVAVFLLVVGFLRGHGWDLQLALGVAGIGASAGIVFLLLPSIVWPFYVVWYAVACCLGLVIGNVLMAAVFYLFVSGLGLTRRAVGRRGMQTSLDRSRPTYWLDAGPAPDIHRYYRQS
jgi:hypothetical protein